MLKNYKIKTLTFFNTLKCFRNDIYCNFGFFLIVIFCN